MRVLVVFLLVLSLVGCGSIVAIGGFTPGKLVVVNGTVTAVQVTNVVANGATIEVTFVSLQTNGFTNQFTFCGNTANQFPMNTSVTVNFDPGQNCNQIAVVIAG